MDTPAGPVILLELSAVDSAIEESISPSDLSPGAIEREDEELYWSLRDALPEKDLKETDLTAFFSPGHQGPAKLLNAFKFMSRKEELKLAEDLFRKDARTGQALLNALPFELLFLLKAEVLKTLLTAMDDRMLGLLVASSDKGQRAVLQANLPSNRTIPQIAGKAGDELEFRRAVASLATACLQKMSGTIVSTGVSRLDAFVLKSSGRKKTARQGKNFLEQKLATSRLFLRTILTAPGAVFVELLEPAALLQVVADDLTLSREQTMEFRDLPKGVVLKIACPGKGIRLKAGAVTMDGLELLEQMTDILPLSSKSGCLVKSRKTVSPVASTGLFAAVCSTASSGALQKVRACLPDDLKDGLPDLSGADRLALWNLETASTENITSQDIADLFPPSRETAYPAISAPSFRPFSVRVLMSGKEGTGTDVLRDVLESAWNIQRLSPDERPGSIALSIRMVFSLSLFTRERKWAEMTLLLLRRLYSALLIASDLSSGERLDILFQIRLLLANSSKTFTAETERILGLLRPVPVPKPTLLRALMHNAFIQSCLSDETFDRTLAGRIRKGLITEKDRKTILQALVLLAITDSRLAEKTLRQMLHDSFEAVLPSDTADLLSVFELSALSGKSFAVSRA
jgi:hypothetical protein